MDYKENILESWIMVEHLSEGDINLNDKTIKTFAGLQDGNYYQLFLDEIQKKKLRLHQKGGIVVYFNIFSFQKVVALLREKYQLFACEEEIRSGDKFSFALYFDKNLRLNSEMTFFTVSYYILNKCQVPKEKEFTGFESYNKKILEEMFEYSENVEYGECFNQAISKLLEYYKVDIAQCRMKTVGNLETDVTNLHSFFIEDLEKAKNISAENLDAYLMGTRQKRKNLDCRINFDQHVSEIFWEILQPRHYPIARFPSNLQYALSLMQQVAVNLAIGYDNKKMRSVNGPPGTGKTTLLRDIFAQLIVEQAVEIVFTSNKTIYGSEATRYYKKASIGQLPDSISEKGIVVASSNNGAVQNIVNELPLFSEIDKCFTESIREADYFEKIANTKVCTKWVEDENGNKYEELYKVINEEANQYWGLFSLEGGKKDNMDYIVTVLKHVVHYLEQEYVPNKGNYDCFIEQYKEVCSFKEERQSIAELYNKMHKLSKQLVEKRKGYSAEVIDEENIARKQMIVIYEKRERRKIQKEELDEKYHSCIKHIDNLLEEKELINQEIDVLKLQKPGFFARRKIKAEYKSKLKGCLQRLSLLINEERESKHQKVKFANKIRECEKAIEEESQELKVIEQQIEKRKKRFQIELQKLEEQISLCQEQLEDKEVQFLDMNLDYDSLQKSNPWFEEKYRELQSQLFITALKVRKQFLYDNRKNVKAAYIVWSRQKEYLTKKEIISVAWDWINMVIPVIGSTFASFSRMCSNLGKGTLGHLFVDEAGQALPQASVGAIFRSRHVMVVGDPAQIKPVLTLDSAILGMLREHFVVSEKYLSDSASTQTLVDSVSQYGFYKDIDNGKWIGIPLWVHRRCKFPMFNIANKISYDGNMVQGIKVYGKAEWYDIGGIAIDKYVKEQGEFLKEKILKMIVKNPEIIDKSKKDIIYVITPFRNVAEQLSKELKKIGFTRYDKNERPTNVGTVHTFQGKEAPIVFLVLGADFRSCGAAKWAVGTDNPNIMNVAATRAKEEFYIIGDKKLYQQLNSDVINETLNIICDFKKNRECKDAKSKGNTDPVISISG